MPPRLDVALHRPAILALLWAAATATVALLIDRYWIPLDDGTLAQSAERVLLGELPHRDFGDPYTGLNALLGAGAPSPLPASPAADAERALYAEFYGTCRAQLAALTRDELAAVASGWRCDYFDVLAPIRAARPVNGGAPDGDTLATLRVLNFML